jgi:hypothetical protein
VSYRDDRDADQARIAALEDELASANKRIAELEGRHEKALVLAGQSDLVHDAGRDGLPANTRSAASTWLGAPLELAASREFDGEFPTARFEDLIEPIRAIVRDPGRTEVLRSSLTWTTSTGHKQMGPFLVVSVSVKKGVTKLAVSDRLTQAAGAVYGGIGGGVGGGTIVAPLALGMATMPVLTPVLVVGWLGAAWFGCRRIYKRMARKRATQVQQIFDALAAEIESALRDVREREAPPRAGDA